MNSTTLGYTVRTDGFAQIRTRLAVLSVSRKGVIGPVRVTRVSAAVVGALLESQLASDNLEDTPFSLLSTFAQKLRAAAVRKRASEKLWTLTRGQALTGFHYLALYRRPDVPADTLTAYQMHAVREVVLALIDALVARRGPERLSRAAVERRLRAWQAFGYIAATASSTGVLVHGPGVALTTSLRWLDRSGASAGLSTSPAVYSSPRLSPDQKTVAHKTGAGQDELFSRL